MAVAPPDTLFDEIIEFLSSAPTAEQIIAFEPPPALQSRLSELLEKNRRVKLSEAEQAEIAEFMKLNRFMSRLKVRTRQKRAST